MTDTVSLQTSSQHAYLFDTERREAENHNRSIESIASEIYTKNQDLHYLLKRMITVLSNLKEDEQGKTSELKEAVYRKVLGLVMDSAGVFCAAGSAFNGGTSSLPGGIFSALQQACQGTSSHRQRGTEAEMEKHNHVYRRIEMLLNELSQQKQEYGRNQEQETSKLQNLLDTIQKLAQLMVGSQ